MARATSSLPTPLSPRISTVARLGAARAICCCTCARTGLLPTISLSAPSCLRSCWISLCVCVEVFGQLLLPGEIAEGQGDVVGHGQRELQIVGIGHAVGLRGIDVNQADDLAVLPDRAQMTLVAWNLPLAVPAAEFAVPFDVAGEHRFAVAQHRDRQKAARADDSWARRSVRDATT